MSKKLLGEACIKFLSGLILVGLLIFVPAGTVHFARGWMLMGLLFVPMFLAGLIMWAKCPELLARRLNGKEKEGEQKEVILLSGLMFIGGFITAGLDFRFGWSRLPLWGSILAGVVFLAAYGLFAEVMRENAYLSRTVEVQEGQKVIDTGLYGIVRHPMYFAAVLLFACMPLVLGSYWAFLIFLLNPFLLAARIRNEEQVLRAQLDGYEAYTQKVKYRLLPYLW